MTGKTLPKASQPFLGSNPGVTRLASVRVYATASKDSHCDTDDIELAFVTDSSTTGAVYSLFTVPAGTLVHDIWYNTATSWGNDTADGGTTAAVELQVGDTYSADTWIADTASGASIMTTDDNGTVRSAVQTCGQKAGRYYSSAKAIELNFVVEDTVSPKTGLTTFWLLYSVAP